MKTRIPIICFLLTKSWLLTAEEKAHSFSKEDQSWWAIQPVKKPNIPDAGENWGHNEIDHFIHHKLVASKLKPAPEASTHELLRRVFFDLHGLPPTPKQIDAFAQASRENPAIAYSNLVDELLDSPRYGERWATHWLDVVRYAETDGYRADDFRPTAYMYRDYVIQSLNEDKPYNEFVREQLAADEFAYDDPGKLIATAFLRHGVYEWNQRDARMQWDLILNEITNITGEVFLGIGIGCARCHDHKFDPILQKDYYGLLAFLSSVWWPENRKLGTKVQFAELARWNKKSESIRNRLDHITMQTHKEKDTHTINQFPEDVQAIYRKPPSLRTTNEEQLAQLVERQVQNARRKNKVEDKLKDNEKLLAEYRELRKEMLEMEKSRPDLPDAFISVDISQNPAGTHITTRSGTKEIQPAYLSILNQRRPTIMPTSTSTGRRTELAKWITRPENSLSTRVIVNRIWQYHFGRGIVPTSNDFGTLGEKPSHPELLDWLTTRFIRDGWKFKSLHKLIMKSDTYRQSARKEPDNHASVVDPGNRLLWRFEPQRLSAEQVRDAMLSISGELRDKQGGPSEDGKVPVRSVYVKKRRNTPDKVLQCFDAPSGFDSAPNRTQTTTPTQSLLLINNEWPLLRARALASRILKEKPADNLMITELAYQQVYGRKPDSQEQAEALAFLVAQPTLIETKKTKAPEKYPDENGYRPITQHFGEVKELGLGQNALWLQPGSRFQQLQWQTPMLDSDSFTIEAVASLDVTHLDASVNTLVSRWNGSNSSAGWTFGVTSVKSRYQPRNFILQLIGKNSGGSTVYEVVPSNLRIPTGRPGYLAASIRTHENGKSTAMFYYKDLSRKGTEIQTASTDFQIANNLQNPASRLLVGGRDQNGHLWDGQIARLIITPQALEPEQLIISHPEIQLTRSLDWIFNKDNGKHPAVDAAWHKTIAPVPKPPSPKLLALTDLCHVLLNSNEFLYLH
ncbi:MAG: DUF1553 domain-containing protein [Opitutae bacterium]|nr:DUF1553 domain-containing protein [Opitutae bacterium]